jgi:hypothetical protein
MNLDLEMKNEILSSASSCDVLDGVVIDKKLGSGLEISDDSLQNRHLSLQLSHYQKLDQVISTPNLPSLKNMLREISPLPQEALFLGIVDDGMPVLLNLWDPIPGPLLVAGDSGAGKTDFLKVATRFVVSTHEPHEIKYSVLTAHPQEWESYVNYPHCIGIFSTEDSNAAYFIRALGTWIEMNELSRQSVLLLIDGLDDFVSWNSGLCRELRKILMYGPAMRIWTVVTLNLENTRNVSAWLEYFHTRVFGYTKNASLIEYDSNYSEEFKTLSKGIEFSLRESSQWIRFWIPRT